MKTITIQPRQSLGPDSVSDNVPSYEICEAVGILHRNISKSGTNILNVRFSFTYNYRRAKMNSEDQQYISFGQGYRVTGTLGGKFRAGHQYNHCGKPLSISY